MTEYIIKADDGEYFFERILFMGMELESANFNSIIKNK